MSGAVSAEEIADDYRYSLESIQTPDRYAINNLTVIAKENAEHADVISNVLVEHIKKAPPAHKLPALYVLDSIAKNIGTAYTLFLGHKLYSTYMNAYSLVDASTRRKMDEMLKTWKSPVPGAVDPRPVFPPEITRKIENALIQARTNALKAEQNNPALLYGGQKRPGSAIGQPQWRNTPTPPQPGMPYAPPNNSQFMNPGMQQGYPPVQISSYTHSPAPNQYYQQAGQHVSYPGFSQPSRTQNMHFSHFQATPQQVAPFSPPAASGTDMALLSQDIERLIFTSRQDVSLHTQDSQKLSKLQALLALQSVINSQQLPADQVYNVRKQVDDLQAAERRDQNERERAAFRPAPPPSLPTAQPPAPAPTPLQHLLNQVNNPAPPTPSGQAVDPRQAHLSALPSRSNPTTTAPDLATLLAGFGNTGQTPIPPPPPSVAALPNGQGSGPPNRHAQPNLSSLLASLTKSGVVPGASASTIPASAPPTVLSQTTPAANPQNQNLANLLALATAKTPAVSPDAVELSSASLKISRPNLIRTLFARRPNQCVTCGRRFLSGSDGKAEKEKHMDWHFRTNQRIQDSSKGIQNRSWYVGELQWIRSKDSGDGREDGQEHATGAVASKRTTTNENYIAVPSNPEANQPCPICQESFETGFKQDIQDFVWLDAIKVGNKIYHASCFADVKRGGLDAGERTGTPDSILGKRKAETGSTEPSPAKRVAPEII